MWPWRKKTVIIFFIIIEIYASSESWINNISIDVWQKNPNIEKIAFKVVQIKFLAMHITN